MPPASENAAFLSCLVQAFVLNFEIQSRLHKVQHKTWMRGFAPVFCAAYVGVFFCPENHNWIPARCPNPRWPFPKEASIRRCNATEPHSVHRGGVPAKSKDFVGEGGATKRWAFRARAKTISEGRDDAPVGRVSEQEKTALKEANIPKTFHFSNLPLQSPLVRLRMNQWPVLGIRKIYSENGENHRQLAEQKLPKTAPLKNLNKKRRWKT